MNNGIKNLNSYMDAYDQAWSINGAILIAKDNEIIFHKAYGFANREWKIKNTVDTKFLIGSITKSFTAVCIMMLVERQLLKLTTSITEYFNDLASEYEAITIHHLLNHTSGIPSYTENKEWLGKNERINYKQEELIQLIFSLPLNFKIGEKGEYSNSNYYLLGIIIEKVTRDSYENFLFKNIFKPINMTDSGLYHHQPVLEKRAYPYELNGSKFDNGAFVDMSVPFAAGAIYSTVIDMLKWDQALFSGKLLSQASLDLLFTTNNTIDEVIPYGYGFFVTDSNQKKRVGHEGGLHGFLSQWYHYLDDQICVIILGNSYLNVWKIGDDIASILSNKEVILPKEPDRVDIDKKQYQELIGIYKINSTSVAITEENDLLFMKIKDSNKVEIYPIGDLKFHHLLIEETYRFERNKETGNMEFYFWGAKLEKQKVQN